MGALVEQSPLPTRHAVRNLLEGLTGRDVDLQDAQPITPKTTNVYAVYVTDRLQTAAVVVVDLEGAARLGGALGMLPRGGVDDAISERDLPEMVRDNTYEVLNVLASVFNLPNAPHVRLYEMYGPNGSVPGDVTQLSATIGSRMDLKLNVSGYGAGTLAIIVR